MKVNIFFNIRKSFQISFLDIELIEPKEPSEFEIALKYILRLHLDDDDDDKEDFNIILNVLTKILMIFGKKPFVDRSLNDPMFLFINEKWFQLFNYDQHRYNIPFLLNGWSSILTQWLKLNYQDQKYYIDQIENKFLDDD
jgi:hypothetical protein